MVSKSRYVVYHLESFPLYELASKFEFIDNFVISITHYFTIEWVVYNLSLEWFWKLKQDNKKLKKKRMWNEQLKKPVPIFKDQIRAFHRGQSRSRYARNFIIL